MFRHLALIGFFVGLVAVGLAAFRNNVIYKTPPPASASKQDRSWTELASAAAKKWVEKKVSPPTTHQPPVSPDKRYLPLHPYEMLYTALGVVALGLGVFSWSQKRHIRLSGTAAAIGIIVVAWEWALIGVLIAVALIIISNLS